MEKPYENSSPLDRENLIAEIVKELEKDVLKEDVIAKLQQPPKKFSLLRVFQHPVFLLVLGFLLTAIVGNRLASRWQSREWERQQSRLVQLRKVDVKYGLINDVVKSYAESSMATNDVVVHFLESEEDQEWFDDKEKQQKLKHLLDSLPSFMKNFGIVRIQLSIYFKDHRVRDLYNVMMSNILNAGANLYVLKLYSGTPSTNRVKLDVFLERYNIDQEEIAKNLRDADTQLGQLIQIMNDEIRADISGLPVSP